jgi:hypothetical protein
MQRTVTLEIDKDAGELSAVENPKGFKYRSVFTAKKLGGCHLTGKLRGVHYGKFDGKQAALIVFEFVFHFELGTSVFRYKAASIKARFSADGIRQPVVARFFPVEAFGEKTAENVEWSWRVPVSIGSSSALPIDVSVNPEIGQKTSFIRGQRLEINGLTYGHPDDNDTNVVEWSLAENKLQKDGIPHYFHCAAIVLHDENFTADVIVKFTTGMGVGSIDPRAWIMTGRPWRKDDPILFCQDVVIEGVSTLPELANVDLAKLSEEQCRKLAPLPKEYQVPDSDAKLISAGAVVSSVRRLMPRQSREKT